MIHVTPTLAAQHCSSGLSPGFTLTELNRLSRAGTRAQLSSQAHIVLQSYTLSRYQLNIHESVYEDGIILNFKWLSMVNIAIHNRG